MLGNHVLVRDCPSFRERVHWIGHHLRPSRRTMVFGRPVDQVVRCMDASVEHHFPSQRGVPTFAGHFVGLDPVRVRVRAFPHGARAGTLYGGTQATWMKPALVGRLEVAGSRTAFRYCVSAAMGEVAAATMLGAGCLSLLGAVVLALIGVSGSLVCLILAAFFIAGLSTLVAQADQGIREERHLLEWLEAVERSLVTPP